jgi:hypothetical protein
MIKHSHIIFLLVIVSNSLYAQQFIFSVDAGIGSYKMNDMKKFQAELKADFPSLTVTDEFPPYVYYQGSCQITLTGSFFTGLALAYGSTGGRTQYRDYSGYVRADQVLQYLNVSTPIGYRFAITEKLNLSFDLMPTYTLTMANVRFEMDVADEYTLDEFDLRSQSFAIQPGILLMRKMGRFGIHAQAAYYQVLVKGKMYSEQNQNAYLVGNDGEPLHAGWEGLRLSVGASILID